MSTKPAPRPTNINNNTFPSNNGNTNTFNGSTTKPDGTTQLDQDIDSAITDNLLEPEEEEEESEVTALDSLASPVTAETEESEDEGIPSGVVALIVILPIAIVIAVIIGIWLCLMKKQTKEDFMTSPASSKSPKQAPRMS